MTLLVAILLAQASSTVIVDPAVQSNRVTTTPQGTHRGLDVIIVDGGVNILGPVSISGPLSVNLLDAGPPLNVNPLGVTSLPVVFVQDAGVLNVQGPLTDTQLRATPVPISAAALPLPSGAATDATLSQLLDGGVLIRGVVPVVFTVNPYPLNPFLPRCNPVRRTGCQP